MQVFNLLYIYPDEIILERLITSLTLSYQEES